LKDDLKEINPNAEVQVTSFCKIDLDKFFGFDGYSYRKEKLDFKEK